MRIRVAGAAALVTLGALIATGCGVTDPPPETCTRAVVDGETSLSGTLEASDCTLIELGETVRYEEYEIALTEGQRYLITLHADGDFVPLLELRDIQDNVIDYGRVDDDGVSRPRNSVLALVAQEGGGYRLRVGARSGGSGAFSLTTRASCGGRPEPISGLDAVTLQETITADDCLVRYALFPGPASRVDLYVLDLAPDERKTITFTPAPGSGLRSLIWAIGPSFGRTSGSGTLAWGSDEITTIVTNVSGQRGQFIVAVGGHLPTETGQYRLQVAP